VTLGIIARCDDGGLGTMTVEACRHLAPDVILAVLPNPHRGRQDLSRLTTLAPVVLTADAWPAENDDRPYQQLAAMAETIYTAETPYHPALPTWCHRAGSRLVVHAMPEYYPWGRRPDFDVWAPTPWRLDTLPDHAPVIPVPVDRHRCALRTSRSTKPRVLHISSGARYDRNGTQLVLAALAHCQSDFTLVLGGMARPVHRRGRIDVEQIATVDEYWRWYEDTDVLVLPRRYGGLSLPMQEAASAGLAVIMLDQDPNATWAHPDLLVRTKGARQVEMPGGTVPVWAARPVDVAQAIDTAVLRAADGLTCPTREYAAEIDWEAWSGRYGALLRHG